MARPDTIISWCALGAQVVAGFFIAAAMGLAPPEKGAILILSLKGETPGQIARWAVAHQARLIGVGPLPYSLVVEGSRAALGEVAWQRRGLLFTGAFAGCGQGGRYEPG